VAAAICATRHNSGSMEPVSAHPSPTPTLARGGRGVRLAVPPPAAAPGPAAVPPPGLARRAVTVRTRALAPRARISVPTEITRPEQAPAEAPFEVPEPDVPWVTLVHNDPVNLMSYVTYVFQTYFGYSKSKATKLMEDVHYKGRAVVSSGSREEMERDVQAMHGYGLWATLTQDR
jgi:ATP-dependent Clp protease adaptor protein ClpS